MRITVSLCLLGLIWLAAVQPPGLCEEQKQAMITGRVTLPDGSAAAGAKVEAVDPWKNYQGIATAAADESGRYALHVPPGKYALRISRGVHVRFNPSTDDLVHAKIDAPASGPLNFALAKGCIIHGSVIDTVTGQMIGGADVYGRNGEHAVTNADGSFQMILPKQRYTFTAVHNGYYRPIVHVDATNRDTLALVIETKPGGTIRGRVTNEQDNPVQGASVGAPSTFFHFQRTVTDGEGRYELAGLDTDAYTEISASKDGYDYGIDSSVSYPSGQREMTLDFKLQKTKTRNITGRVTKPDGSPAAGAKVAYGWTSCYVGYKEADAREDGNFELAGVDTTKNVVMAHAEGFAPAFDFVEADKPAQLELPLKPGHIIEGRFVDENGDPVSGVHMSICVEDPVMDKMGFCGETTYRWLYSGIRAGDDGAFKLDSLPEKRIIIEAYSSGHSEIDGLQLEVDQTDHVVTLKSPGEIAGTVVRADTAEPITSFRARVTFSQSRKPGDISSGLLCSQTDGLEFTPADGTFSISRLTNGATYRVEIDAPGYRRSAVDRVLVQPQGKADPSQLVFKLHPASSFEGVITDLKTGTPVEDVLVTVIDREGRGGDHFQWRQISDMTEYTKPARTNAQGRFKLDSVASGSGQIMLEKPGYARILVGDVAFGQPFKYALDRGATISGVVVDNSGKPEQGVSVCIEWLGKGRQMVSYDYLTTDADGKFRSEGLPGGHYIINQRRSGSAERMIEADIASGEDFIVDWNRPGEAVLKGSVTLEGKPVEGAHILLHPIDGWMYSGFADTGKDGNYQVSLYKAGGYKVRISRGEWMDPNHIWIKKTAQIKPGINQLNVEFPSAQIAGRVLDASGKPVQGLTVRAYHHLSEEEKIGAGAAKDWSCQHTGLLWWPENTATTDADGAFEIKNLVGGEWLVATAAGQSVGAGTKPFVLAEKQKKKDVVISLSEAGRAEVGIIDPITGKAPEDAYPVLVDESGFVYYPAQEDNDLCRTQGCAPGRQRTGEGRFVFPSVPPGNYRAIAAIREYTTSNADIKVSAGGVAKIDIKPKPGPKIIFRLKETEDDSMPGLPWLGYSITRAETDLPALEDELGPTRGGVIFFDGEYPRKAIISIQPGKYDIKAGLRTEASSGVIMAHEDIWSYEGTIEVIEGKDVDIEVDWRRE